MQEGPDNLAKVDGNVTVLDLDGTDIEIAKRILWPYDEENGWAVLHENAISPGAIDMSVYLPSVSRYEANWLRKNIPDKLRVNQPNVGTVALWNSVYKPAKIAHDLIDQKAVTKQNRYGVIVKLPIPAEPTNGGKGSFYDDVLQPAGDSQTQVRTPEDEIWAALISMLTILVACLNRPAGHDKGFALIFFEDQKVQLNPNAVKVNVEFVWQTNPAPNNNVGTFQLNLAAAQQASLPEFRVAWKDRQRNRAYAEAFCARDESSRSAFATNLAESGSTREFHEEFMQRRDY